MSDTGAGLDRIHTAGGWVARIAYGGFAALFLLLCLLAVSGLPDLWLVLIATAVSAAVVSRGPLLPWAVCAGAASLFSSLFLGTAVVLNTGGNPSLFAEIGGLLIVTVRTVWRMPRDRAVPVTVLLGTALLIMPLRWSLITGVLFTAPLGVLLAIAIGAGLYLRAVDARRSRSVTAARRDERLELARDLHDFVAHHVTGIVVQAQAARFAASSGAVQSPEQLDTMFGGIEKAGTEALTSMRRMVGLLRDAQHVDGTPAPGPYGSPPPGPHADPSGGPGDRGSATRPVGDLDRLRELVAGFADPPAVLSLAPDLGPLPPEVATSAHRVVQEALTNIRKHAADATYVRVSLARFGGGVEVAVRNDGRGRGRRLPSSGFGLTGLAERVTALGGRLHAGPRPEGGWEVVAVLPLPEC
ncbi:sensor histidine kinase [Actinomadura algeriensis]|uniref:histidine kinase n=1 Tax=Actinomadura algeriensis TaxID=1679523 RepID=A0ABR9JIH1_9ACTN|nr:histidine kinase [Actinomadura algeriensis]MBE1530332.1 signal transduction histidine kinase [Actinomadura algeriensis]